MLHHIVMWTLQDEDKAANVAEALRLLQSCAAITPGIRKFEVVVAQADLEATCDLMLNSSFTDRAALAEYQNHPDHIAIKPFMKSVVRERQCLDYEA